MGRPETKCWVSPATTTVILCLILMWQGHAIASSIFPLNSYSQSGSFQQSSSPWDLSDIEASDSDNEYASFFPDEDMISSFEQNSDKTSTINDVNNNGKADLSNSLEASHSTVKIPGKSKAADKGFSYHHDPDAIESITLPQTLDPARTRPPTVSLLTERHSYSNKETTISHLAVKQNRFGREKITTTVSNGNGKAPAPSHDMQNNSNNENADGNGNEAQKLFEKISRFFPDNSIKNRNTTKAAAGNFTTSSATTTLLINEASKNQSEHRTGAFGRTNASSSLQFKFPYRIPFPYVRRGNNEDEHKKKAYIKSWNTNEEQQRPTDPSKRFYSNGDVRLQRRNRSKRDTLPTDNNTEKENQKVGGKEEEAMEKGKTREDGLVGETQLGDDENQQHKSSEGVSGSGSAGVAASNGGDEVAETNVRDNATSRPPLPSNPVEVLQRLTRLLDRMLRELSMFGQKFTLRLIRMTERQDIDQMQEIMRDFDISPEKPIFFIAGGLRKLNGTVAARVVPLSSVVQVTAANLTGNEAVVLNETVQNVPEPEVPPVATAAVNATEEEKPILPQVDEITTVPILRPSGISSLPVEFDDADNEEAKDITTTENPESEVVPTPNNDRPEPIKVASEFTKVIPASLATHRPLLSRRKRAVPEFDEFHFFPIPSRSARTENPYDDEDEMEEYVQFGNYAEGEGEVERWYDQQKHLTSTNSNPERNMEPVNHNASPEIEMINQSQTKRSDEIRSNDSADAIIGHVSGGTSSSSGVISSSTTKVEHGPTIVASPHLIPLLNSSPKNFTRTKSEQVLESEKGSNDQHLQGEQNIHPVVQTKNAAIFTTGENNTSHVEKYLLPTEEQLRPKVPVEENVEAHIIPNNSQIISTDRTLSIVPNLEINTKPISSSFVDGELKADKVLNLAHEISVEEQGKITLPLESGNKLEKSKVLFEQTQSPLPTEINPGSSELFDDRETGNSNFFSLLPFSIEIYAKRSYDSNSADNENIQSVLGKVPLDEVILIKNGRDESGNQQLFATKLKSGDVDSREVGVSSLNPGVISESEGLILVPPTRSSPAVEQPISVTDIISPVSRVPILRETVIVPVEPVAILENRNVEAPHGAVVINSPQESNQNDPQVEIKAEKPSSHANVLLPEINIPVVAVAIKESVPTPSLDQVSSITLEHVPVVLPKIQQRTISSNPATNLNSIQVEEAIPAQAPNAVLDSPLKSHVTPQVLQTEASNALPVSALPPTLHVPQVILDGESNESIKQTRNKQQTFTLGENQETLVGGQSVVVGGDVMKKVGEEGNQVESEIVVQVSPNQPTFHAPTVLKESQLIGNNNNATFLPTDKIVPTAAHTAEHVVVREAETVDFPDSTVVVVRGEGATDNVDATVKNTGAAIVQNSENTDASAVKGKGNGSIVVPIVSDNGEVRNPIATGISPVVAAGKENDALSQSVAIKNSLPPSEPIISQESSNVGSLLLSANDIKLPLPKSTGNILSEDRLNTDSPSERIPSVVPISASASSKNVDVQVEKIPFPESEGLTPLQIQDVRETGVNKEVDVEAVNDLSKIVQNIPKPEGVKEESVPVTSKDTSTIFPVGQQDIAVVRPIPKVADVQVLSEPVKVATVVEGSIAPVAQVVSVPVPIEPFLNVAGNKEDEIKGFEKVTDADKIQESESIVVVPDENGILRPVVVEPSSPVVVKTADSLLAVTPDAKKVAAKEHESKGTNQVTDAGIAVIPDEFGILRPVVPSTPVAVKTADSLLAVTPGAEKVLKEDDSKGIDKVTDAGIAVIPDEFGILRPVVPSTPVAVKTADSLLGVAPEAEKVAVKEDESTKGVEKITDAGIAVMPDEFGILQPIVVEPSTPAVVKTADTLSVVTPIAEQVVESTKIAAPEVVSVPPTINAYAVVAPVVSAPIEVKAVEEEIVPDSLPVHTVEAVPYPIVSIVNSDAISKIEIPPSSSLNAQEVPKPAEILQPSPVVQAAPVETISLVEPVLKLAQVVIPDPLVAAVPKPIHETPNTLSTQAVVQPYVNRVINPTQIITLDKLSPVQPVGAPSTPVIPTEIPSTSDENIVASLPPGDPDSAFGIKPIDLQPHYQIPGLRPTVPERPHPDYLEILSPGVDADSLTFSSPTTPVIVRSPPVYSSYSPSVILQRHKEMMQHYFNGLFARRALPV